MLENLTVYDVKKCAYKMAIQKKKTHPYCVRKCLELQHAM